MPQTRCFLIALSLGMSLILGTLGLLSHLYAPLAQAHESSGETATALTAYTPHAQSGSGVVRVALTGTNSAGCGSIATPCATIQFAVDQALAGEEIHITAGTYTGVSLRAGTSQHVYISKTLTLRGGYSVTNWIVSDLVANPTVLNAQGGGRVILATTPLFLENLSLINGSFNDNGGGLLATSSLTLTNVEVLSNTAQNQGGGVYAGGNTILNGGSFENNRSLVDFGGGLITIGTLTMTDTEFINNRSGNSAAGALAVGFARLNGGLFQENQTSGGTGGFYAFGSVVLTNTRFLSNTATGGGAGGLFVQNGTGTLNGGLFQNNRSLSGGAIETLNNLIISETQFISNATITSGSGGALRVGGILTATSTQFLRNSAGRSGGAIYLTNGGSLNNLILDNNTAITGGGIYLQAGTLSQSGGVITLTNNTATTVGGGVYVNNGTLTLNNARLLTNTAATNGGALHQAAGTSNVTNSCIVANSDTAVNYGAESPSPPPATGGERRTVLRGPAPVMGIRPARMLILMAF